jgi:hypothetical protein
LPTSVRQYVCPLIAAAGRRACQFALVAEVKPAITETGSGLVVAAIVILAVVLVAVVVLVAIFSARPARRRAAMAVLDRIFRWKG